MFCYQKLILLSKWDTTKNSDNLKKKKKRKKNVIEIMRRKETPQYEQEHEYDCAGAI